MDTFLPLIMVAIFVCFCGVIIIHQDHFSDNEKEKSKKNIIELNIVELDVDF